MPQKLGVAMNLLAIDPGDKNVGIALMMGHKVWAHTLCPALALEYISRTIKGFEIDELVMEEFRLYPNRAMAQAYSTMDTSQMIGAIRWICNRWGKGGVSVHFQPASIKIPTRSTMNALHIPELGDTVHARDACLHLHHRVAQRVGSWERHPLAHWPPLD